jgi:hypothetical protein
MESEDAFYQRPDNWDEQIAFGKAWLEKEDREAHLQAEFEQEIQQVRNLLRSEEFSEDSLRHTWGHLQSWGRGLPDELQRSVDESLSACTKKGSAATGGANNWWQLALFCCC